MRLRRFWIVGFLVRTEQRNPVRLAPPLVFLTAALLNAIVWRVLTR